MLRTWHTARTQQTVAIVIMAFFLRDLLFSDCNRAMEDEKEAVEDCKVNSVWQFCSVVTCVLWCSYIAMTSKNFSEAPLKLPFWGRLSFLSSDPTCTYSIRSLNSSRRTLSFDSFYDPSPQYEIQPTASKVSEFCRHSVNACQLRHFYSTCTNS